ncbi:MAG: hypothetical protein JEY94_12860 [Melioribacteraceae bacterium]|nr:hypothetical protein [Melioribacteraceae bacterium]
MKKPLYFLLPALFIMLFLPVENFSQSGTAVTFRIGTLGAEIGVVRSLNSQFNVRGGINFLGYTHDGETDPGEGEYALNYEADLNFFSIAALVDYMPFENWFRLSAGLLINTNDVTGTGMIADNVVLSERTVYTPEQIGKLELTIEPSSAVSPYIGIGYGNPVASDKKLGFFFDLGVIYQGSPDVILKADKNSMIYPTTDPNVHDNAKVMEDAIQDIKWYPVLTFGLSYQF